MKHLHSFSTLLKRLRVEVCPYTHRYYVRDSEDKNLSFDPFFSKESHPYLCLSFYNLIPCSKESVIRRNGRTLGVNPYDLTFPFNQIKIKFTILKSDWILNEDSIKIEWDLSQLEENHRKAFQVNIEVLQLTELFQVHKVDYSTL